MMIIDLLNILLEKIVDLNTSVKTNYAKSIINLLKNRSVNKKLRNLKKHMEIFPSPRNPYIDILTSKKNAEIAIKEGIKVLNANKKQDFFFH